MGMEGKGVECCQKTTIGVIGSIFCDNFFSWRKLTFFSTSIPWGKMTSLTLERERWQSYFSSWHWPVPRRKLPQMTIKIYHHIRATGGTDTHGGTTINVWTDFQDSSWATLRSIGLIRPSDGTWNGMGKKFQTKTLVSVSRWDLMPVFTFGLHMKSFQTCENTWERLPKHSQEKWTMTEKLWTK